MRRLAVLALVLTVWGCGGGQEDADDLKKYVNAMKKMDGYNKQVKDTITNLDEPSYEITKADLDKARRLVDTYVDEVRKVEQPAYRELRRAYDNYLRKLELAAEQAVDTGRELRRERGNVAIALREIENLTKRHYKSGVDLLWGRQNMGGEMPLQWPK